MTEAEYEQHAWETNGDTVYWGVGGFSCWLDADNYDKTKAIIRIQYVGGQCPEDISVARSITVAEAKRLASGRMVRKMAGWIAEAAAEAGYAGDARELIHDGLLDRALASAILAAKSQGEEAEIFLAQERRAREMARLFY